MKLFEKYSRINLVSIILIFLIASFAFFLVLRQVMIGLVDDDLKIEQHEIEAYVKEHQALPETISVRDQSTSYEPTSTAITTRKFFTNPGYDSIEREDISNRVVVFGIRVGDHEYKVQVTKSLKQTDQLIRSILLVSFAAILLILAATFIINRILLKRLWKPFYKTLDVLKNFKLERNEPLVFPQTDIDEFSLMNRALEKATGQARTDYVMLKEFTENASHEMQTPLAIIRSKLDLFIQHENLSEEQSQGLQGAYSSVERLSKLNQSLLLLAKIENQQYGASTDVDLEQRLKDKAAAFHELWRSQEISVTIVLAPATVRMNKELADILLNNLLSNATRHNMAGGRIDIELKANKLLVANTGQPNALDNTRLFSRFYKESGNRDQTGLGLSIARQICEVSGFQINYSFEQEMHRFRISW